MKAKAGIIIGVILLTVNVFVTSAQDAKFKVGLCMTDLHVARWNKEKEIIIKYVEEQGGEVLFADAYNDAEKQRVQAEEMMEKGIKVLIIVSVDGLESTKIIDKAHEKNIKVIGYDRLVLYSDLDYFVSFDNIQIGKELAQLLVEKKPKGNYVIINGPEIDFNTKLLRDGVMKVLRPYIGRSEINVILDKNLPEWSGGAANVLLTEFLSQNDTVIDAIFCGNDVIGVAVVKALRSLGIDPKTIAVVGHDADLEACRLIVKDEYTATIWNDVEKLALEAATIAVKMAKGEEYQETTGQITNNGKKSVPSLLLDPVVVNKGNINSTVIENNYWSYKDVYEVK